MFRTVSESPAGHGTDSSCKTSRLLRLPSLWVRLGNRRILLKSLFPQRPSKAPESSEPYEIAGTCRTFLRTRNRIGSEVQRCHEEFWEAPDGSSATEDTMRSAFGGIAEILHSEGLRSEQRLSELHLLVWYIAISGGWYRYASESFGTIFTEQLGPYFLWRDPNGPWLGLFDDEIEKLTAKLSLRQSIWIIGHAHMFSCRWRPLTRRIQKRSPNWLAAVDRASTWRLTFPVSDPRTNQPARRDLSQSTKRTGLSYRLTRGQRNALRFASVVAAVIGKAGVLQ